MSYFEFRGRWILYGYEDGVSESLWVGLVWCGQASVGKFIGIGYRAPRKPKKAKQPHNTTFLLFLFF